MHSALLATAHDLERSPLVVQSVTISYTLAVALLIPINGWLGDHFGILRTSIFPVSLFTLGSLLSTLSTTLKRLVTSRIIQRISGDIRMPVARLALLRT